MGEDSHEIVRFFKKKGSELQDACYALRVLNFAGVFGVDRLLELFD